MGCFSMFMVAVAALVLFIGGTWWLLGWMTDRFTEPQPVAIQLEVPNEAQYGAANDKLSAIRAATRDKRSVTVEFTAADMNALIERHPDFSDMRGKFRVAMADSIVTLDMSVPLRDVPLPRIKDRWLNGTTRFGMVYHDGSFNFSLRSLTANGRDLPMNFLDGFSGPFNSSFNERFDKAQRENARTDEFWEDVKTVAVLDDKLVVTTKGEAPGNEL